jgi:folate-binding protein YgfZ
MNEAVEELTIHKLPLEETHRQLGATFTERDGWMLPANYGDARAEYEAAHSAGGAGLFDASARGRIEVRGAEAVQFLNGLITNDVKTLAAGAWMHAAFPNVQGRLLARVRVARPGDEVDFLIDTEPATHQKVFKLLERFTLAGDFRVKDVSAETVQLSLQGARASALIESVFGSPAMLTQDGPPQSAPGITAVTTVTALTWRETYPVTILRATHAGGDVYDIICGRDAGVELWDALIAAGARALGFDAFEVLRVEAGDARYGVDMDETSVVLEVVQEDEAVSYTKGCYIGQEIIARIHWRGHVAKRLAGLVLADERELDAAGAKVRSADGREIGRITSTVFSPHLKRRIALAVLKYDYLTPGTEVSVVAGEEERAAHVSSLPFTSGSWYKTYAPGNGGNDSNDSKDVETT